MTNTEDRARTHQGKQESSSSRHILGMDSLIIELKLACVTVNKCVMR